MSGEVFGCAGCATSGGRMVCPDHGPSRVRTVRVEAESIGAGLLRVREAHRYCTNKAHGGHDFEDCPVLAEFRRLVR